MPFPSLLFSFLPLSAIMEVICFLPPWCYTLSSQWGSTESQVFFINKSMADVTHIAVDKFDEVAYE